MLLSWGVHAGICVSSLFELSHLQSMCSLFSKNTPTPHHYIILEAECNFSEGELAWLKSSRKVVYLLYYSYSEFKSSLTAHRKGVVTAGMF